MAVIHRQRMMAGRSLRRGWVRRRGQEEKEMKEKEKKITTTTIKPFVLSIRCRLHEPKENFAGSGE